MDYKLNSFQIWARYYAGRYGFTFEPCGNWVTLYKHGKSYEAMSAKGVQSICRGVS